MTSRAKVKEGTLQMWGGFSADDKCDQNMCGFWSVQANMCGIAAMGLINTSNLPQPDPIIDDEETEEVPLLNPEVSA
jgi:hypothetical protein